MNAKVIIYLLGKISAGLAIAQLLPLLMSVVYGEYATSRTFIFLTIVGTEAKNSHACEIVMSRTSAMDLPLKRTSSVSRL